MTSAHSLSGVSEPGAGAGGGQPPSTHLYLIPLNMGWGKIMGMPVYPSQLPLLGQQPHATGSPARAELEQVTERRKVPHP